MYFCYITNRAIDRFSYHGFCFLQVEQKFILMDRGYIEGFTVQVNTWPGALMIAVHYFLSSLI